MGKAKVSVLMTTYNRADFLERSINSVLSQTMPDFEFILVNNGSTDWSKSVCEKYKVQDSRIHYVDLPVNHGSSLGRNVGLDFASGEYIAMVDDDDYCEPEMLRFLFDIAEHHSADISMCGSWNEVRGELEPYFIFNEVLEMNREKGLDELLNRRYFNVAPPTKLFRRSLFDKIRFPSGVLVDDIHTIYRVFARASVVVAHGVPLYRFRKHEGNMTNFIQTSRLTEPLVLEYLSAFAERTETLCLQVPDVCQKARYAEWSYMISACQTIEKLCKQECIGVLKEMKLRLWRQRSEIRACPFTTCSQMVYINSISSEFT